jgi:hypothetical protein
MPRFRYNQFCCKYIESNVYLFDSVRFYSLAHAYYYNDSNLVRKIINDLKYYKKDDSN